MSTQLYNDLGRVAEITYQRGLERRGIALPEAEVDPAFLETARGRVALQLLREAGVDLESPWATPFWNLREAVQRGGASAPPSRARSAAPRSATRRTAPRAARASVPRARAPKLSLSRLVSVGLREAPDSGLTVTRLVDKHIRSGKAKSTGRLFGMPLVITTTGNAVRVAFAMESR